jgi:hypothetical protein
MFTIPTIGHLIIPLSWAIDYGVGEIFAKHAYFVVTSAILLVLMVVQIFMLVNWIIGVATIVGLVLLIYYAMTIFEYFTHNFYLEPRRLLATQILTAIIVLVSLIVAVAHPKIADYEGLTLSVFIAVFMLWAYTIMHFIFDMAEEDSKPIYYSLTLFPIYKYYPGKGVLLHYKPTSAFIGGVVVITFWSFFTAS